MLRALLESAERTLRRWAHAPGWTAAVVTTLALGIAAVTVIFSAVDAMILRPLPFDDSERVVILCETAPRVEGYCVASPPNARDWAQASRTIERFGVGRDWPFVVTVGEERISLHGGIATGGLFDVLHAHTAAGRTLADTDLEPGRNQIALLSWRLWNARFGADPAIVGRTLELDDAPVTVVGVLARDAALPGFEDVEIWTPLTATPDDVEDRSWRGFTVLGRLAPGSTLDAARAEMEPIRARLADAYPVENRDWGLRLESLRSHIAGPVGQTLWLLMAAVGLLLVIACVNVAHLLLAQATRRRTELAVRAALGGGRARLARQLLAEGLALATVGAVAGVLLAAGALAALRQLAPPGLPRLAEVGIDARVLAFAALTTLVATVGFALLPALRATPVDLPRSLRQGRGTVGTGGRTRGALVVAEVALALMLLVGAALVGRGFARLTAWDPGLPLERLTVVWLTASPGQHSEGREVVTLFERVADEVGSLPGVDSVALSSAGPLFGGSETATLTSDVGSEQTRVRWFDVSPGLFSTLGVPLVRGRDLAATDDVGAPLVVLVNRSLAERLWPGSDPIGRQVQIEKRTMTVVGEVADVRPQRPDHAVESEIYWPKRQSPRWGTFLVVRMAPGAANIERALTARIAAVDPNLAVGTPRRLAQQLARTLVRPRFVLALVAAFALAALALAALGTYGVLAYAVASRSQEIGVRLTLGATPRRIVGEIVQRGMRLTLLGVGLGMLAAVVLGGLLAGTLYGVRPTDPAALAASAALFLLVSLVACGVPAGRASRIDPVRALRDE